MQDHKRPDPQRGIFETLLVLDGFPVELDAHLARQEASLAQLFPALSPPKVEEATRNRCEGIDVGSVRISVAPRDGELQAEVVTRELDRGLLFPAPTVRAHCLALDGGLGAHKWADRALLDAAQSRLADDELPLVVDHDGAVLEASRANLFAALDGALSTPPLDGRILPGITRARVLALAAAEGLETSERELSREDLLTADEVFLTGSVRGVERVRALDGTELRKGGEVTASIAAELCQGWAGVRVG